MRPQRFPPILKDMPVLLHGGDYNPEQWIRVKDRIWHEDMRFAREAGINCLSVGIFSWSHLEPAEGEYRFDWLDEVMDMMAENGIKADLATPSGARPRWLAQKYPSVLRVAADRTRNLYGQRHNHCLSSPEYREKVSAIDTALALRYKDHPALAMWHISNEVSGDCHCPLCQARFREWVKERYHTLDELNARWWTSFWSHTYTDWSQVESPSPKGDTTLHGLSLAWQRFTTDMHIEFLEVEKAPLRSITPDKPVTANLMAGYEGIDYRKYAQHLDFVSWDNYPTWKPLDADNLITARDTAFAHDLMYGLKRRPFILMESTPSQTNWHQVCRLHRPGVLKTQSLQALAHGADSVMYFQFRKGRGASEKFHGAVIGQDGTDDTRTFREVCEVGETLKSLSPLTGCGKDARVALLYDYENAWALAEVRTGHPGRNGYRDTAAQHYGALWKLGVSVDIIGQEDTLDGYDLVILPKGYMLKAASAEKLKAFTENGGTLVTTCLTGYVDDDDLCFEGGAPGPLMPVTGLWAEELDALYQEECNRFEWNGTSYRARYLCEVLRKKGAEVLSTYQDDFYRDTPCVTVHRYGKGRAYHIAADTEASFTDRFYRDLCESMHIDMPGADLPQGVITLSRTDGTTRFVFYMNFSSQPRSFGTPFGPVTLPAYQSCFFTGEDVSGMSP